MANDTEFGLAAYFLQPRHRPASGGYGIIGISAGIISPEIAPFGGMKAASAARTGNTASRKIP